MKATIKAILSLYLYIVLLFSPFISMASATDAVFGALEMEMKDYGDAAVEQRYLVAQMQRNGVDIDDVIVFTIDGADGVTRLGFTTPSMEDNTLAFNMIGRDGMVVSGADLAFLLHYETTDHPEGLAGIDPDAAYMGEYGEGARRFFNWLGGVGYGEGGMSGEEYTSQYAGAQLDANNEFVAGIGWDESQNLGLDTFFRFLGKQVIKKVIKKPTDEYKEHTTTDSLGEPELEVWMDYEGNIYRREHQSELYIVYPPGTPINLNTGDILDDRYQSISSTINLPLNKIPITPIPRPTLKEEIWGKDLYDNLHE